MYLLYMRRSYMFDTDVNIHAIQQAGNFSTIFPGQSNHMHVSLMSGFNRPDDV